jgi:hypothetical protein
LSTAEEAEKKAAQEVEERATKLQAEEQVALAVLAEKEDAVKSLEEKESLALGLGISGYGLLLLALGKSKLDYYMYLMQGCR